MDPVSAWCGMVAWHCLADYPLQGDYLSRAKDRHNPLGAGGIWVHALGAHSIIHGAGVWVMTGVWWLGLAEIVAHGLTDFAKTEKRIGYHTDQAIHLTCKIVWAIIVWRLP